MISINIVLIILSLIVLVAYNVIIYLFVLFKIRYYNNNDTTNIIQPQFSINLSNSIYWLHYHKDNIDPASNTLAIQTLRNFILVGIFVGGLSFQSSLSKLSSFNSSSSSSISSAATTTKTTTDIYDINAISNIIVSISLLCSFLCWVLVIRMASQLGFVVTSLNFLLKENAKHKEKSKLQPQQQQQPHSSRTFDRAVDIESRTIDNNSFTGYNNGEQLPLLPALSPSGPTALINNYNTTNKQYSVNKSRAVSSYTILLECETPTDSLNSNESLTEVGSSTTTELYNTISQKSSSNLSTVVNDDDSDDLVHSDGSIKTNVRGIVNAAKRSNSSTSGGGISGNTSTIWEQQVDQLMTEGTKMTKILVISFR